MRYYTATLVRDLLVGNYDVKEEALENFPETLQVIVKQDRRYNERFAIVEYVDDVSGCHQGLINELTNNFLFEEVFENVSAYSYSYNKPLGADVTLSLRRSCKFYSVNKIAPDEVELFDSDNPNELLIVKPYEIDWNCFFIGKRVRIIENCSPELCPDDYGKTAVVDWIDNITGEIHIDGKWSDENNRTGKVFIDDVEYVPLLKVGTFCKFKTPIELIQEFGNKIFANFINEYISDREVIGDSHFYVDSLGLFSTVNVYSVKYTPAHNVNSKFLKASQRVCVKYDSFDQIKQGDYVYDNWNGKKGQVVYNIGNVSLVEYFDYNISTNNYYGVGERGKTYAWVYNGKLEFCKRGIYDTTIRNSSSFVKDFGKMFDTFNLNSDTEIKIGDEIVIRNYEDMLSEFGSNDKNEPNMWCRFSETMKKFCGRTAIVTAITERGIVKLNNWNDNTDVDNHIFSLDMIRGNHNTKNTSSVINITRDNLNVVLEACSLTSKQFSIDKIKNGDILLIGDKVYTVYTNIEGDKMIQCLSEKGERYYFVNQKIENVRCVISPYSFSSPVSTILTDGNFRITYVNTPDMRIEDIEILLGKKIVIKED